MKKHALWMLAPLLTLLTSCTTPRQAGEAGTPPEQMDPLAPVRASMAQSEQLCAISYVGYVLDTLSASFSPEEIGAVHAWAEKAPFVDAAGDDVFVLIPASEECRVEIQDATFSDTGELLPGAVLYSGDGSPVILRCNVSDIVPNTVVTVTGAGGDAIRFSPAISLRDGSVFAPGTLDITQYPAGIPARE